jgi:hypothetical protein
MGVWALGRTLNQVGEQNKAPLARRFEVIWRDPANAHTPKRTHALTPSAPTPIRPPRRHVPYVESPMRFPAEAEPS